MLNHESYQVPEEVLCKCRNRPLSRPTSQLDRPSGFEVTSTKITQSANLVTFLSSCASPMKVLSICQNEQRKTLGIHARPRSICGNFFHRKKRLAVECGTMSEIVERGVLTVDLSKTRSARSYTLVSRMRRAFCLGITCRKKRLSKLTPTRECISPVPARRDPRGRGSPSREIANHVFPEPYGPKKSSPKINHPTLSARGTKTHNTFVELVSKYFDIVGRRNACFSRTKLLSDDRIVSKYSDTGKNCVLLGGAYYHTIAAARLEFPERYAQFNGNCGKACSSRKNFYAEHERNVRPQRAPISQVQTPAAHSNLRHLRNLRTFFSLRQSFPITPLERLPTTSLSVSRPVYFATPGLSHTLSTMPMDDAFSVSGNIVDVIGRRTFAGRIDVRNGRIEQIEPATGPFPNYLLPGFVDAHVHVESSMLVPSEFARLAVVHGTVATVSDPHEIANVLGVAGVRYMLDSADQAPLKITFGAPSCVPATRFDHSGATLGPKEVAELLDDPQIGYLSEMMNFPGVLSGDADVLAKIAAAHERGKPVDGHAPGLRGEAAAKYIAAGISTDHESGQYDEALGKLQQGMKCQIREGSAAKNFEALHPLIRQFPGECMFCSDDKHPHELVEGHINVLVRRAVALGYDLFDVLTVACVNPVKHYRLNVGLLQPGDPADFIELGNLMDFVPTRVWINGQVVAEEGRSNVSRVTPSIVNRFETPLCTSAQLHVPARHGRLQVIEVSDGQIITRRRIVEPKIVLHEVVADTARDILKMVLVNRYGGGPPAIAFVRNFGLRHGAIASSVSHDSHNVIAVGADDESLARAINLVIQAKGGVSVVGPTRAEVLPLPVAGLMSDRDGYEVARDYARLDAAAKRLGSKLSAPFMTLSFMALLVIPELKLGPPGLFDVNQFQPVDLFVPES
jgi:adenine deaminase